MAKIEKSFEAVCNFMARDQFLESCSRELYVNLKPKAFVNLYAMATEPDLFAEVVGAWYVAWIKGNEIIRAQRKVNPKVSRAEILKINEVFADKGI